MERLPEPGLGSNRTSSRPRGIFAEHSSRGTAVNIEELETEVTSAPMSGETLFRARARQQLPATVTVDTLRGVLEALAADLVVDLTFSEDDGAASNE